MLRRFLAGISICFCSILSFFGQSDNEKIWKDFNGIPPIFDKRDFELLIQQTESNLMALVRDYLKTPSTLPYNYTLYNDTKHDYEAVNRMHERVLELFNNKSGGSNGIFLSNTLHLETKFTWTDLIVEPNPLDFKLLEAKQRKAWLINACFSIEPIPKKVWMTRAKGMIALGQLVDVDVKGGLDYEKFETQCFSFMTILAAAKFGGEGRQMVIDYWSLDIEGAELKVLQIILWDFVYIKVITIEANETRRPPLTEFLEQQNFQFVESFTGDYIHDSLYINNRFLYEIQIEETKSIPKG